MTRVRRYVVLALILVSGVAATSPADDRGLAAVTDAAIRSHVGVLASDAFRGRLPGTAGEDSTLAYLEREYRAVGLEPMLEGSYRQAVPLVRRTILPTPTIRLQRLSRPGTSGDLPPIRWGADLLVGSSLFGDTLSIRRAELVFVGYGITAPELGWDDYAGFDCRGKVVLALSGDPGRWPYDTTLFAGRALTSYGLAMTKQEIAAAHGAVGIIAMHDTEVLGYPFDILTASAGRAKFDLVPGPSTRPRPALSGMLQKGVFVQLLKAAGFDPFGLLEAAGKHGFQARPTGIALDLEAGLLVERDTSYNVLGLLPGGQRTDEVVVYSAHWDHMGVGVPVDGDSIYNGAVDNASGTAALLTLARAFHDSGRPPARSVLFWATTCEEQGLLGAYHYADHPVVPLAKTVALINMDALFPFGATDTMVATGFGQSDLEDWLVPIAAAEGRAVVGDGKPETGVFYRSDHYPMARKGVPAIFAVGLPRATSGRFGRFVRTGYHKPSDELTPEWDTAGILQDVRCYYRLGRRLADGSEWPNWHRTSEFRPARDAMMRR